jgi:hypothetical protein
MYRPDDSVHIKLQCCVRSFVFLLTKNKLELHGHICHMLRTHLSHATDILVTCYGSQQDYFVVLYIIIWNDVVTTKIGGDIMTRAHKSGAHNPSCYIPTPTVEVKMTVIS